MIVVASLGNFRNFVIKFLHIHTLTRQLDPQGWPWDFWKFSIYARILYQKTSLPTPRPLRHDFDKFLYMSKKCQNSHFGGFWHFLKIDFFPKNFHFFSKNGHFTLIRFESFWVILYFKDFRFQFWDTNSTIGFRWAMFARVWLK